MYYVCSCLGSVGDEIEMGKVLADGIEIAWDDMKWISKSSHVQVVWQMINDYFDFLLILFFYIFILQ